MCTLKTAKHCWEKFKNTSINGKIYMFTDRRCKLDSKWVLASMQAQSKFQKGFKAEIDKLVLKFIWRCKGPRIAKNSSATEEQS